MSVSINFFVNGELYYASQKLTLYEIVDYFNYNNTLLVLEHNNLICSKKEWKKVSIKNQDKIEIVTIVGGG